MDWWTKKPRKVNIIVDNDSWIIPFAHRLVDLVNEQGDNACFFSSYNDTTPADISFYLGCVKITPKETLEKSKKNLVVHASDLPSGRGFSPLTWQILEGKNDIPVCLLEMAEEVDAGAIIYKDYINFKGNELLKELQFCLGKKTIEICLRYTNSKVIPCGIEQKGKSSYYSRRRAEDSILNPHKSIIENFNLLRIVDNEKYPAYFEFMGRRYVIHIKNE